MKPERVPWVIETERLVLRTYDPREDDGVRLFDVIDRNRVHLSKFMSWSKNHTSVDVTRTWVRESYAKFAAMTDFAYGIYADGDRLVGGCGLHVRGQPSVFGFEIGYWLVEDAQRSGYAREAAKALTRVAIETAEADRVVIRAQPDNLPSRRIPEALGYTFEGIARKSLRQDDEARDAAMYSFVSGDKLIG